MSTKATFDSLAENTYLTVSGRLAMLFCAFVALPTAGFLLAREVEQSQENELAIARLEASVATLQRTIEADEQVRYTAADAVRDFRLRDEKDAEHERRLEQDERILDRLQTSIHAEVR